MGTLTYFVIQNGTKCSEGSRVHKVGVSEIFRTESSTTRLPPSGRLNDKREGDALNDTMGTLTYFVIQNGTKCSEGSRVHKVDVSEILPPYGRLNDNKIEKQ